MSTAAESKLVTYALPEKRPTNERLLLACEIIVRIIYWMAAVAGGTLALSVIVVGLVAASTGDSEIFNEQQKFSFWMIYFGLVVLIIVAGITREKTRDYRNYWYWDVLQGEVVDLTTGSSSNGEGVTFYVHIRGNNRLNDVRTSHQKIDAYDWVHGGYTKGSYADISQKASTE